MIRNYLIFLYVSRREGSSKKIPAQNFAMIIFRILGLVF
jgi:hypothetical protein